MNVKEIKEMIALMNENELTELEVEREGSKIRLKKGSPRGSEPVVVHSSVPLSPMLKEESLQKIQPVSSPNLIHIKAPMVGTFYRAPSPEAPAYVEVGQTIAVGQVVCIIEAMKLMNEIKAEVKGKLVEVLIGNGEPVEYGQELFRIEPM